MKKKVANKRKRSKKNTSDQLAFVSPQSPDCELLSRR